jgi:chemotaxis protein histidine kinase CheA
MRRLDTFRQVVAERVARLNLSWIEFETKNGDLTGFLRESHTLKGEASLTGFAQISRLVHALEDLAKRTLVTGRPDPQTGDRVLRALDLVARLAQSDPAAESAEAVAWMSETQAAAATGGASQPSRPTPTSLTAVKAAPTRKEVRVAAEKIDRLRLVVSDVLLSHVRARQLSRELRHIREMAMEAQRLGLACCNDELDRCCAVMVDGLGTLEGRLREESHSLSRVVSEIDEATRDLRMTPLWTLFERFPVAIRAQARSLGRQVRLDMVGDQVEVDKTLIEMLEEPLLHLLRNAIDHAVEDPARRQDAGKPSEATLRVHASLVGQRLHLHVSDDGAGIDVAAVRQRALELGIIDESVAELSSERDLLRTIFAAGFSTRRQVSELSGRGIGLNVVLDVVEGLGGSVEISTQLGQGTTFHIEVPITVAISRIVLFRVGMGTYGLPASSLRALVEARALNAADGPDGPAVYYAGVTVPVLDLVSALDETRGSGASMRVMIAQSGADLVALRGSSDHLEREVVLKPLGRFFERQPLVTSAVTVEDGTLAVVLKATELVLLARRAREAARNPKGVAAPAGEGVGRVALVTDDSPVVRDIIAEALRSYGLHVLVAGDGEEALAVLAGHPHIDIIVTDMDMPRLDGLGLVRAVREKDDTRHVPVVAISMRGSEAERRAAADAGVQAFIDKSDFNQALLWRTISPLVHRS